MAALGKLNPLIAAIVMVGSSLLVVANARRLLNVSVDSQRCESRPAIFTDPSKRAVRVRGPSKESERHDP